MSNGLQTKIQDSKSWVFSLRHFTKQNAGFKEIPQEEKKPGEKETQYVIAATFDKWLALRLIDVQKPRWIKIYDMKMTMPVVNSFIEFDPLFKPLNIVLAYFDGSIECCPWDKIYKYYSPQIQGGKMRQLTKTFPQVISQMHRPIYINLIIAESQCIEETFMLETICFLHKKKDFIYAINYKGELKIFSVNEKERKISLVERINFGSKVVQAEYLARFNEETICFQKIQTPFVFQLSSKITKKELQLKIQTICKNFPSEQRLIPLNIKSMCYDPNTQRIITCTQKNDITIFSLEKTLFLQKDFIIIPQIEKKFSMGLKEKKQNVNDLSVKNNILLILSAQTFYLYDIAEQLIIHEEKKLKDLLDIGKLVAPVTTNGRPLLLIKKKFEVLNPKERTSTTLHLFGGK